MTDITVLRLLMDGVAKIRRASEQLRSVEEIQPWWGIPWSRVDRHFVAIDNRGAGRIGERDNAAPNGSRCAQCAARRHRNSQRQVQNCEGRHGDATAFVVLTVASYSERTEPLARTALRTE